MSGFRGGLWEPVHVSYAELNISKYVKHNLGQNL